MQSLFRALVALLTAVLGLGLFALSSNPASADDVTATRQDAVTLFHDDDDDDDDDDDTGEDSTFDSNTGESNDATGSKETAVSQDRDLSVDDNTKDRTMDGGDPTKDRSENRTNDSTKNDTSL